MACIPFQRAHTVDKTLPDFGLEIQSEFTGNFAKKPTAPGVPRRSPIQVLSWPDDA